MLGFINHIPFSLPPLLVADSGVTEAEAAKTLERDGRSEVCIRYLYGKYCVDIFFTFYQNYPLIL